NVVTQTIAHEGEGRWKEYAGGYADWQRARPKVARAFDAVEPKPAAAAKGPARRTKLGFNEARELEALPAKLEALEREQEELMRKLADPALYQDRGVDLKAMNERSIAIEQELTRLLTRWEELERKR